ncbi:MAG: hypothetical protein M1826_006341 [Phylliscum demangeonii]|nr:MAG: hypothetical protein M1826_006341 [Phylliscum demangeonii]
MILMDSARVITQPGWEEVTRKRWEAKQEDRQLQRETIKEAHEDEGFPAYAETAKRRLANDSFAQPFQLEEDPKRQDERTTWIEYIEFECWWLDRHTTTIQRLQARYDKERKTLVDSAVLRASETPEDLCTVKAREERLSEVVAKRAMHSTSATLTSAQAATNAPRLTRLREAEKLFETTKPRQGLIRDFLRKTKSYRAAKKDARRHEALVQWVLEQAALIEAELKQRKAAEGGADATSKSRKTRRPEDPETQAEPSLKKRKQGDPDAGQRTSNVATQILLSNQNWTSTPRNLLASSILQEEADPSDP